MLRNAAAAPREAPRCSRTGLAPPGYCMPPAFVCVLKFCVLGLSPTFQMPCASSDTPDTTYDDILNPEYVLALSSPYHPADMWSLFAPSGRITYRNETHNCCPRSRCGAVLTALCTVLFLFVDILSWLPPFGPGQLWFPTAPMARSGFRASAQRKPADGVGRCECKNPVQGWHPTLRWPGHSTCSAQCRVANRLTHCRGEHTPPASRPFCSSGAGRWGRPVGPGARPGAL